MKHSDTEKLLQQISDALDESGEIPAALLAEAQANPEAREFLAFWTGDTARTLESPLPPCGIALRDDILKLATQPSSDAFAATDQALPPVKPAIHRSWFSAAAAAAIVIGCGWLLYQNPASPGQNTAANYKVTPREIAAIQRDIDHGLTTVATPLSAMRMTFAQPDTH